MDNDDGKKRARKGAPVIDRPILDMESGAVALRIKKVIGDEPVAAFARRAQVSESVLRDYVTDDETKRKKPGMENLQRIASAGGVTIDYLVTGRSASLKSDDASAHKAEDTVAPYVSANDFVYLPLHRNVSASAGNGSIVWDEHDIDHLAFQTSFIRQELRANPASLRLVRISGDSMERLLYSGDMVMVDTSITALQAEGMYVFRIDDSISVKWLNAMPGGVIRVVSENTAKYPPYEITREQADDHRFQIIGLVRWWAHTQR